jgi:SprT protein
MLSNLQSLADNALQEWMQKLNNSSFDKLPRPIILLNQRGRIAGAAVLQKNLIKLQPKLFAQNTAYFLSDVIPHELAHLAVFKHYGRVKPHGKEWQYLMSEVLGVAPRVTHSLDVQKAGIKMYDYRCLCGLTQLSATRHNRVVAGRQTYVCRRCGQTLKASDTLTKAR